MITFYDLAAQDPIKTWSPNLWKTRYVLNYKKLPYKTVPLEYPDLKNEFKKLRIPPSGKKPDGSPHYTCPSIIDHSTNTPITDSYAIAEYLDKAYPTTPQVIPPGTEALQAAFYAQFNQLCVSCIRPLYLPRVPTTLLNPPSAEYYNRARSVEFGKPLSELEPKGEERMEAWKRVEAAFDNINGWLSKSPGPFLTGENPTFADFTVAAAIHALKICFGENSEEWNEIVKWNNGRWAEFEKNVDQYAGTEN